MPGHPEELKRAIRVARSRAGIKSDQELALRAGVHLQTIQNWMYGKTVPRPSELAKVARTLGVPMADLMAVYEGIDPEPPPLYEAIRELVAALAVLPRLVEQSTDGVQMRLRAVEAELESLRVARAAEGSPEQSALGGTRG